MSKSYQRQWRTQGVIIRQRGTSFQVETHHNGRRKRETFKSETEAEAYAKRIKAEFKAEGEKALAISGDQRIDAARLLEAFPDKASQDDAIQAAGLLASSGEGEDLGKPKPTPLAEAVRFWLLYHPENGIPALDDLLTAYLKAKDSRRKATLDEIRVKVGRFVAAFPGKPTAEITPPAIEDWLTDALKTIGTQRQYLTVIRTFFDYAVKRHGLPANPAKSVCLDSGATDQTEVEAYTVDECRRVLNAAIASKYADMALPVIAIGLFAGLRPAEVQALDWSDVSFDAKRIRVSPETAKKRRSRYVDMPENLVEWLKPYAKDSGPVAPPFMTFRRARAEIHDKAGVQFIKDGYRHCFGTYHLAAFEDAKKTAFLMGHRNNTELLYMNYRKLVTREQGLEYWQVTPPRKIEANTNPAELLKA